MKFSLEGISKKQIYQVLWIAVIVIVSALIAWPLGFSIVRYGAVYPFAGIAAIAIAFSIFRSPWVGMLMLGFFLPFERIGSVDIAGSTIRVSQVVIICLIGSLFLAIGRNKKSWKLPAYPIALPLFVYVVAACAALLTAPNIQRSIVVLAFVLFTMSVSFLVPLVVTSEERAIQVMRAIGASLIVVGLFGIYQFVGDWIGLPPELTGMRELYSKDVLGFPRVQSTALEPLYYANYLLLPLSVLLSLFLSNNKKLAPQWQILGLLVLGGLNLVLTVARGGYIAFAASVAVVIVYYFVNLKLLTPRNLAYAAAVLGVLVIGAMQFLQFGLVAEKAITHVTNLFAGASFNERVDTFEIATQAFQLHPWVGIGVGSFGPYASWHPTVVPDTGWAIVNNLYLEVAAETGVIGLLALVSVFLIVILRSIHALRYTTNTTIQALLVGTLAAFVGILVQYNTFSVLYIVHVWFVVGLLLALQHIALQKENNVNQ